MRDAGQRGGDAGASARPVAGMIVLVVTWWLTTRDAAAAGGSQEAVDASQWTMWLVAGPMLVAALYVWRSVFVEIGATVTGAESAKPEAKPVPSASTSSAVAAKPKEASPPTHDTHDTDAKSRDVTPAATPSAKSEAKTETSPTEAAAKAPVDTTSATTAPDSTPPDSTPPDSTPTDSTPPDSTPPDSTPAESTPPDSAGSPASGDPTERPKSGAEAPTPRPHTHRIGDTVVDEAVAMHAAAKLLTSSSHGAVVFSADATDEANAILDRIADVMHATRYVAGTGPNVATAERLASEGDASRRALHEMELALAIAGRGIDVVLFADERGEFGELTLRSLATMDSICLADQVSRTSESCRVLLRFDGEPARVRVLQTLLDAVTQGREASRASAPAGAVESATTSEGSDLQRDASSD